MCRTTIFHVKSKGENIVKNLINCDIDIVRILQRFALNWTNSLETVITQRWLASWLHPKLSFLQILLQKFPANARNWHCSYVQDQVYTTIFGLNWVWMMIIILLFFLEVFDTLDHLYIYYCICIPTSIFCIYLLCRQLSCDIWPMTRAKVPTQNWWLNSLK